MGYLNQMQRDCNCRNRFKLDWIIFITDRVEFKLLVRRRALCDRDVSFFLFVLFLRKPIDVVWRTILSPHAVVARYGTEIFVLARFERIHSNSDVCLTPHPSCRGLSARKTRSVYRNRVAIAAGTHERLLAMLLRDCDTMSLSRERVCFSFDRKREREGIHAIFVKSRRAADAFYLRFWKSSKCVNLGIACQNNILWFL